MQIHFFSISVSYLECENLYGRARNSVVLMSEKGIRVQLPVMNLRPFIQRDGLHGRFRLTIDESNKIKAFERIR